MSEQVALHQQPTRVRLPVWCAIVLSALIDWFVLSRLNAPFSELAILGLAALLGWLYRPRTDSLKRWASAVGVALSVMSIRPLSDLIWLTTWRSIFAPVAGLVGATLIAIGYVKLGRGRSNPFRTNDAQISVIEAPRSNRWQPLLWGCVLLHAAALALYWGYTTRPCSRLDPVRRSAGCQASVAFPAQTRDAVLSADGLVAASITHTGRPPTQADPATWAQQVLDQPSTVQLWGTMDGAALQSLPHPKRVLSLAFAPDRSLIATGSGDNIVRLWRVDDGTLIRELSGHTHPVAHIVFAPNGQTLASLSNTDHNVRIWSVRDGTQIREWQADDTIWDAAFAPDGSLFAIRQARSLTIYRVSDGMVLRTIAADQSPDMSETSIAFAPDGRTIATIGATPQQAASADEPATALPRPTVQLWRVADGQLLATLSDAGLTNDTSVQARGMAFSPDAGTLAVGFEREGSNNDFVQLWRIADGMPGQRLNWLPNIDGLQFEPNGSRLLIHDSAAVYTWQIR